MGRRAMKREFPGSKGTPRADDVGSIHEWDDNDDAELIFNKNVD
jgi:hypothetical protein